MKDPLSKAFLVLALFSLSLASGIAATQEYKAGRNVNILALSLFSDQKVLTNCLTNLTNIEGRLLQPDKRRKALQNCETISQKIIQTSAFNAFAWFVSAFVSFQLNDTPGFNAALMKSYDIAPTESWLAMLRVSLAEQAFSELSDYNSTSHINDITLLLNGTKGYLC